MTDDQRRYEPLRLGGIEFRDRSSVGASGASAGNGSAGSGSAGSGSAESGSAGNGSARSGSDGGASPGNGRSGNGSGGGGSRGNGRNGNGPAGNGSDGGDSPDNGRDATGSDGGSPVAPVAADRRYVPPDVLESMREQVADFADFAHRGRAKLPDQLKALGSGGGITAQVVRTVAAEVIRAKLAPWLGADEQALTDSLMLSLVAPSELVELSEGQRASFVVTRGQLMIDVSTAEVGNEEPVIRLVAPPAQQWRGEGNADETVPPAAAAVIVGAAAVAERPYVSLDMLMTRARRAIFDEVSAGEGQHTGGGLRAASKLEIVVLLEKALGGGLWIDVDPATSRPAAALAIGLTRPPGRIRFTHVLLPDLTEHGMLVAGRASG